MEENTTSRQQVTGSIMIMYILSFSVIIYGVLLFLLETFAGSQSEPTMDASIVDLLSLVFLVIAAIQLLADFKFLVPSTMQLDNLDNAFPRMLISMVLLEAIGIYGLLLGLLDLFATGRGVQWELVLGFLGVSFVAMFYLINNKYAPKIRNFGGPAYHSTNKMQ